MKESFEIMPDQEHYSLRWNNHQNHILRAFDTLLQTKTLVDVTLVCAETSIRAHKVVLSACSPFFQRVFSETPCKHPVIVLKDFRGWVVQAIVDFMYRGEISVPQERLSVLIQAGESLQVRGLVDHPVAANTPTPAQSPEDFSLLDTSLISPTSPSLPSPNFQSSHQSGQLRHHPTTATGLISSNTPKLLLPPQVFADPSISLPSATVDPCTSPMPRRKQARPRRRSGDCAPQDLSSKPSTPIPQTLDDEDTERELLDDRPDEDEDDLEELDDDDDDDDDDLKRILHRSQSVDEKLAALVAKEDLRTQSSSSLTTTPPTTTTTSTTAAPPTPTTTTSNSDERRSRSLHKLSPRKTSSSKGGPGLLQRDDDLHPETAPSSSDSPSVADGPENLCIKKSSPSSSELIRSIATGGVVGEQRNRIASIDALDNNAAGSETNDRTGCRDDAARLPDGAGKDSSPLSDTVGGHIGGSRGLLSLKDIRHLNRAALNRSLGSISPPPSFASLNNNLHPALSLMHHHHHHHHHHGDSKRVKLEDREDERSLLHDDMLEPPHFLDHMDLALSTHQHPLAHHLAHQHHLRNASPNLRPPTADGVGGTDNNSSGNSNKQNNSGNSSNNNNGSAGANNHSSILNQHHGNPNNKHHHHPSSGGGRPGTPKHSSSLGNNNNNNVGSNSSGSSGNNNSLHHGHHPHHHPHNGPKGSAGGPKDFLHSPTLNFPPFFNHSEGPPRPTHSPLPFPHMPSVSSLTLTPPHMFGLDSPLGLFPPGMDPGKIYSPLMEMSDPRGMHHDGPPFLKKKMNRPKGQHSAPRGGPPRSWTNAELTEALQHVWNKKMTTSQASRIFGIPYNSLLMYVRGKYGKSLKLEQLRKDCISGPPIELLQMGVSNSNKDKKEGKDSDLHHSHHSGSGTGRDGNGGPNGGGGGGGGGGGPGNGGPRSASSEPDLLSSPNPLFNPFPGGFYPDFPGGFPGLPLSMLNLLPPERHPPHTLPMSVDEDCKSDRSKQSLDDDFPQPLALNRPSSEQLADSRREIYQQNGQD
ncbi:protein jim lovell isoform X2 [Anopheles stephensi]|uniref:protein jim lovell isoform X2 n=1 Tax=Anopheles stephensi TaxID=30069 RepID=UPI0016588569|nr:protein jim lovell isoform X2 [Anopheles stephensi]